MVSRISKERLSELKSRLQTEAVRDFITIDLIGYLVVIPVFYLTVKPDLIFSGGAYLFLLIINFLNRQLWVGYNAKIIVNHFSVELIDDTLICRQGNIERTFDLRNINCEINRYNELTIISKNRRLIDIILHRQACSIPPETNQYQAILSRIRNSCKH